MTGLDVATVTGITAAVIFGPAALILTNLPRVIRWHTRHEHRRTP